MYAMDDQSSFDGAKKWVADIQTHPNRDILICIVNNIRQPTKHVVDGAAGKELANSLGCLYYEIDIDRPSKEVVDQILIALATGISNRDKEVKEERNSNLIPHSELTTELNVDLLNALDRNAYVADGLSETKPKKKRCLVQ
eukprot:TRINITY_DN2748_c0_g1_i10.p1 TRINITY_DN2748_c0_g1~~TRINITY_DN2748_c0_g1_i10.p1  ORF type:complete len:141 (-),score=36.56 TRINITY_DN2748_c0_g1_i10:147-569(-)